ncbi:MAG: 3-oxoacyl-(acyl-carrier-protein) synthase 2 [Actinomycetia bacterium]|jgi:3-oxoacyl-[acyl-carrier-protein] synthase II|nr:3-oxoacyl-(acyl-carrier-protein) synthase 2 [Actinomycetes bacterium]MDQ1461203.1 3-oxoacyl-[acyl-carrier-protein] synthase [Actinomycetota bacterium]
MAGEPRVDGLDHRGRVRVAVTGLGVKTGAGSDIETFWSTLAAGRSTAAGITRYDPSDLPVRFGCEVVDFDPTAYLGAKDARRVDRVTQLGFAAAADALADAGEHRCDPARSAVIVGTGVGGLITLEEQVTIYNEKGSARVSPFLVPMMMANATAGTIAMQFGWKGPNFCVATACAASANAIGEAARLIRDESADIVMTGGSESCLTPTAISAFARMTALSSRNDDPEHASRPFDADRDGFVMGEGAAALVLERWDHAVARGAHIYGEVVGYGRNADAYHITAPSPGGEGAAACMQLALEDAGLSPGAIGHVNAHGTSTPMNDAAEAEAIGKVFGGAAPPVTSTKGVTGHLIGAAGATEAIACLLTFAHGAIPPTANLEHLGEEIALDVVAGGPRSLDPAPALSNSFGFGGHNATLVLAPPS